MLQRRMIQIGRELRGEFSGSHHRGADVSAGIVRWVRGEEFGIEGLVMDGKAQAHLRD